MTWFERITGVTEHSPDQVRSMLSVSDDRIVCPNGHSPAFGRLEIPSLAELRQRVMQSEPKPGRMRLSEIVADVRQLHSDDASAGAMFQVASQFNLLEMASPSVTPERGVGIYESDHTQGPACAISCGAGTIYRNYFAVVGRQIGQSSDRQIDCAADLGALLGNHHGELWRMQNGYLFPSDRGLEQISLKLSTAGEAELDGFRSSLRIGIQWDAEVTLPGCRHRVSQAYCSALPVAYSRMQSDRWSNFACLVLEAAYESTICAALLNAQSTGCTKLYLTMLGGGVFGNHDEWITGSIARAVDAWREYDLDVSIVCYGSSKPAVRELLDRVQSH